MYSAPPDYRELIERIDLNLPLIGLYDIPDPQAFEPLVFPSGSACVFAFFKDWKEGRSLCLSREKYGCGGAGRWMWGIETRSRRNFLDFLANEEGLKASEELMARWIDSTPVYQAEHSFIIIGPLQKDKWDHIKTVTFFVNPDQLSILMTGAQYHSAPDDIPPVIAPFSSGCGLLLPFRNLESPQAAIGSTDIAMRQYLPPDILSFSVTRSMFARLCSLEERSFLYKPFLKRLRKARGSFHIEK